MAVVSGALTDWASVARSGATIDGRTLEAETLKGIAASYNPGDYTAVVNYNHTYGNLGTVRELRTVENDGVTELQARIRPNKYYYMYNSESIGLFFSIEYIKNFAKTGKPYLVGLAATDNPASLGTSELHFSADFGDEQTIERGGDIRVEAVTFSRRNPAELFKELFTEALSKFFNPKKDDETMTKEEMSLVFNEALQPFKTQLEALSGKVSEKVSVNENSGPEATNELSENYKQLKESYDALKTSVENLSTRLEESLKETPGRGEKNSSAPADEQPGFII